MAEKEGMGWLPFVGAGLGAANTVYNMFQNKDAADRRQQKQQQALTDIQLNASKDAAKYNQDLAYDMWEKTNYGAQREQMEKAGLNPALIYGSAGQGGSTVQGTASASGGGSASDSASMRAVDNQMGLQMAQMGLIAAQTEKTKAETENLGAQTTESGARTEKTGAETKGIEFDNEVKRLTTPGDMAERYNNVSEQIKTETERMNAEWEAYKAKGWEGKLFDDPSTPIAKALAAGWEKTVTEAENAKKQGSIMDATKAIEEFKAGLAKQGIAPDSPWYVKLLGDLLEKIGMPVTKATTAINKL